MINMLTIQQKTLLFKILHQIILCFTSYYQQRQENVVEFNIVILLKCWRIYYGLPCT